MIKVSKVKMVKLIIGTVTLEYLRIIVYYIAMEIIT